jgi:hypothetical protein
LQVSGPAAPLPPPPPPAQQPQAGAKPVVPQAVPKNTKFIIGALAALVIFAAVYFVGLPLMKAGTSSGNGTKAIPSPIPTMTMVLPTVIVSYSAIPPTPVQKRDDRYEETYEQIYAKERDYKFGEREVFSHELTRPPLFIQFNITPSMVSREKLVDIGLSTEHNITAVYISPNAWFEVKVLDADTGAVIDKRGFNRDYSVMTNQEFMVRTKGNYRIEMSGNDVSVSVKILIGNS